MGVVEVIETKEERDKGTFISKIPKAGSDPKNLQTNSGSLEILVSTETNPLQCVIVQPVECRRGSFIDTLH